MQSFICRKSKMLAALLCAAALMQSSFPARAQVRPTYSRGAAGLGQLLRRLQTTASALHTAAHPDDEDSALIARLARGDGARVAYLSATRGEGGQNVIGPDLSEPLGVIRTEELMQARTLDGGEQLFTRAFDYGFTKTMAETAAKWGERETLGDMVRAIRKFRPLVVVSRFSGTPADGHGHHQFVGHLTPLAFRAAGDSRQFPEHLAEGLRPWRPLKLYVGEGFAAAGGPARRATLRVETGLYDPLIGRTFYEVAAEGRSQHKTQEMGSLELRGEQSSGLRLVESCAGGEGPEGNLFDGIDTSINGIPKLAGLAENVIAAELSAAQAAAARALSAYNALDPSTIVAPLAEGLRATRRARAKLSTELSRGPANAEADFLLAHKEREFAEALRRAAGVEVDALAGTETVAPGESFVVSVRTFLPKNSTAKIGAVSLRVPDGWRAEETAEPPAPQTGFRRSREATPHAAFFRVNVPANARPTTPYWLEAPRDGNLFRWPDDSPKNEPFAPPLARAVVRLEAGGEEVEVSAPVQYRYADDVRGELRRDLNVVPALAVGLDTELLIVPASAQPQARRLTVSVTNHSQGEAAGRLALQIPAGWKAAPTEAPFTIKAKGQQATVAFDVTVPGGAAVGEHRVSASATLNGRSFDRTMRVVSYPHIQTRRLYAPAEARAQVLDLKVAPVSVGYVMGTGDRVPEAIARMGLSVTLLDEQELTAGDLSRFDTVVVGVRASQARPDFVANHARLLEYVRAGGTLVVQYQQQEYLQHGLAPFKAEMTRASGASSNRVADETAPVRVLAPEHPAFNFPNRITGDDWAGWVQERNLYSFTTFAPEYTPLLEAADPGEEPQRGGMLYAELGRGRYVYTSYAWFRQLPAGVPGAYRLFANLLSLPRAPRVVKD